MIKIQEYARKTTKTNDTKYNVGRKDCINGYFYTKEAQYFIMVENIGGYVK